MNHHVSRVEEEFVSAMHRASKTVSAEIKTEADAPINMDGKL
jgi:hypothetical protein